MIKKIAGTFFMKFGSALINLLIAVVVSRYLGAVGKGEQGILIATISFIILFDNLVGGATVVYLTPRLKLKSILFVSYIWSFILSIAALGLLLVINIVPLHFVFPVVLLSFISSISSINSSILIGKEEIWKSNLVSFVVPVITIAIIIALFNVKREAEIIHYIYALYGAYISGFVMSFFFIFPFLYKERLLNQDGLLSSFRRMIGLGFQNQLAHVFQLLNFRLSFFVIERYWGSAEVGVFSNGVSLIESVWMISGSITLYQYSRIVNSEDGSYSIALTELLAKYAMLVAFLVIIPFMLMPSSLYVWIFGPDFSDLNRVILILAPGVWLFNYALIMGHYFSGTGRYYKNTIASAVGFVVLVPAVLYFVPIYHYLGAALSASISYAFTALVVLYFFRKDGGKLVLFPSVRELRDLVTELYGRLKGARPPIHKV